MGCLLCGYYQRQSRGVRIAAQALEYIHICVSSLLRNRGPLPHVQATVAWVAGVDQPKECLGAAFGPNKPYYLSLRYLANDRSEFNLEWHLRDFCSLYLHSATSAALIDTNVVSLIFLLH